MVLMCGEYRRCRVCQQEYVDGGVYPEGTTYTYRKTRWLVEQVTPHLPGCELGYPPVKRKVSQ